MNSAATCSNFKGALNRGGYGILSRNGKTYLAHRVAYCEFHEIPIEQINGLVIRHECDNRSCVEPLHLRLGTQAENVEDMMRRGRHRFTPMPVRSGTAHVAAKLDYAKARQIRQAAANGATQRDLARDYGVSQSVISRIITGKIWDDQVGLINEAIAPLSISASGLAALGFRPVAAKGAAKLYAGEDFPRICDTLAQVIAGAPARAAQKKAA